VEIFIFNKNIFLFLFKVREKIKIKTFCWKRKIPTKSNFTITFTKVVTPVGLFMLKKNLYLFFRSVSTHPGILRLRSKKRLRGVSEHPYVKNESAYDIGLI